jgi:hypothetical protein
MKMQRKRFIFLSLLFALFFSSKLLYPENDLNEWNYDDNYKKKMIFLHAFVNYELDPSWEIEWERNLYKANGLRTSFGSVTVKDLNSEIDIKLNYQLGKNWFFRASILRRQTQYGNQDEEHNYMGFETRLYKNLSIFSLCNATYDKEDIDLLLGFSIMNKSSEQFCRLALTYDDFLYDEKNPSGGQVSGEPLGVDWAVRAKWKAVTFFSKGKYMNPLKIELNDAELSPERYFLKKQTNDLTAKLYCFLKERNFIEFKLFHYHYLKQELFYQSEFSYYYLNEIYDLACKYNHPLNDKFLIKPVLHYILQNSKANGLRSYNFSRKEIIPMVLLEYERERTIWEVGLMRSAYDLELDDINDTLNYTRTNSTTKFMIRWTHKFNRNSKLQFSLSHVPDIEGYGGGNLNFMLFF